MHVSFSRLTPTTFLISLNPRHSPVPTSGFSFNEMLGFSVLSFPFPSYLPVFPSFIVFGCLSVILQGKVIKGQHIEGALLRFVILFSRTLLFVFCVCLWLQTLSGRWACDKPSLVLCGEIIWRADKALWVSRFTAASLLPPLPFPLPRVG